MDSKPAGYIGAPQHRRPAHCDPARPASALPWTLLKSPFPPRLLGSLGTQVFCTDLFQDGSGSGELEKPCGSLPPSASATPANPTKSFQILGATTLPPTGQSRQFNKKVSLASESSRVWLDCRPRSRYVKQQQQPSCRPSARIRFSDVPQLSTTVRLLQQQ